MTDSKVCTKCNQTKSINLFHKHRKTKDGYAERCKDCRKSDTAQYRENNREKVKQSNRDYHARNKEFRNAIRSARYWKNPEASRAASRAKYPQTAEQQKMASKLWRLNNPDKRRVQEHIRRAREKNVYSEPYTDDEVLAEYGTNCHLCGLAIDMSAPRSNNVHGWENGLHIDHVIPISKNGEDTLANVRPAHGLCNLKKGNR